VNRPTTTIARIALAASLAATALVPTAAGATTGAGGCPELPLSQPFRPLLDAHWYFLAPNGGFEDGDAGWRLSPGARVASGTNQTLLPQSSTDDHALALPPLTSATTAELCVEGTAPTMRIFARSTSFLPGALAITVVARRDGSLPQVLASPSIQLLGGWGAPTALFRLPWIGDDLTDVTVTISSVGLGTVQVDDVFIDPLRQR
jgi:hypothetical protein